MWKETTIIEKILLSILYVTALVISGMLIFSNDNFLIKNGIIMAVAATVGFIFSPALLNMFDNFIEWINRPDERFLDDDEIE